jgi:hypothetical protein
MTTRSTRGSWPGDALAIARTAVGCLTALWLPAAALLFTARKTLGTEGWLAGAAALVWLALSFACRGRPPRLPALARWALALALLALGLAGYGNWLQAHHAHLQRATEAELPMPPGAHHAFSRDEFGKRGDPGRDRPAGVPVVALVGCSMIFGSGVADADAPHVRLEESLRVDHRLETRVYNFASSMEATNAMTRLVREARERLAPDLLVVYLPGHHAAAPSGLDERRELLATSPLFRLFVAAHWEMLYARLIPAAGAACSAADMVCQVRENLDAFLDAAAGTPLLLVPDLRDASHFDSPFPDSAEDVALQRMLAEWFGAHPDVAEFDVSFDETWAAAGTLPDRHWNAEGIRTTMAILARRVAPLLRGASR